MHPLCHPTHRQPTRRHLPWHLSRQVLPTLLRIAILSLLSTQAMHGLVIGFPVSNLSDSGPGSLRQAILDANAHAGADFITFANGVKGTIELASPLPTVTETVTLVGPGAGSVAIDANLHGRVLHLDGASNSIFTIEGLTLTGGFLLAENGAGILLGLKQHLVLDGVHIVGNGTAFGTGGGVSAEDVTTVAISNSVISQNVAFAGGGLWTLLDLDVDRSTIHDNMATLGAAGLAGYWVDLSYTTVADNYAPGNDFTVSESGGVHVFDGGELTMVHTTVTGNMADASPGVLLVNTASATVVTSSIVAGNRLSGGGVLNCGTSLGLINGHNLSDDASCGFSGIDDLQNLDPQLLPLMWAGGPTPTRVPMAGSSVIDRGNPFFCGSTDQRGFASPIDGDAAPGAACDLGAVEYKPGTDDLLIIIHSDGFESGDTAAWSATVP